jgi:hypothetical protein
MIRELIGSTYKRTIGAVWNSVSRPAASLASRIGAIQLIYVLVVSALLAGLVNAAVLPVAGSAASDTIYPGTGSQTISETFIDAMVILVGGAGIYLVYISGRQTTKARMVNFYLAIALLLVAVSVMMGVYVVSLKG